MPKLKLRKINGHGSLTQTGKGKKLRRPYVARKPKPPKRKK